MADYDYETNMHFGDQVKDYGLELRLGFIRKVFSILSIQLLLTLGLSFISANTGLGQFQVNNPALLIIFAVAGIIIMLVLVCCKNMINKVPTNYILLFAFTFCEAYLVSTVVGAYSLRGETKLVLTAVALTVAMTIALTLYACFTKSDITTWGGVLFCLGIGVLLFGLLAAFSGLRFFQIAVCIFTIVVYGIYLVYDIQLIMGGKRHELGFDDYILAAISLYLDVIVLFLEILKLLSLSKGE